MANNYSSDSMFNDSAGPLWNQYDVRLGKVGPDAGRYLAAYMYPTAVSQLQSAYNLEPARQQFVNNGVANASWGNQMAQTNRNLGQMANANYGQTQQQVASAQAAGMSPEYVNALRASMAAHGQHQQNQYLAGENQRFADAQNKALAGIYQAQQAPMVQQEFPYLSFLEQMRQESENRRASGQGSALGSVLGVASGLAGLGWQPLARHA